MIEVILQHRDTGMFLGRECDWRDTSRDALIFATADEALRFAAEAEISRSVRAVVRFREENCHILLPLQDAILPTTGRHKRGGNTV